MFHVEEFVAGRLRDDPLNPVDLAIHANVLSQRGEQQAVREAFKKAMIYGGHNPFVRRSRIKVIALHPELRYACDADSRHYTCQPGLVAQRDTIIIEARAKSACGEATERSWQDVVRYLLNLTE